MYQEFPQVDVKGRSKCLVESYISSQNIPQVPVERQGMLFWFEHRV